MPRGQGSILDVDEYATNHRVQINAHDLRILDPFLAYPSTILGREKAIVLNLEVRYELEQLLDDDDDMADLYLSRKAGSTSPVSESGHANWFAASPTIGSKISRASIATIRLDENDVEELEIYTRLISCKLMTTLNKLTIVKKT